MHLCRPLILLIAFLVVSGCGADGEESTSATTDAENADLEAETPSLEFSAVQSSTLRELGDLPSVSAECKELRWASAKEKQKLGLSFVGTTRAEILTCEGIPYLFYYEYEDASAADEGLGASLLPYLRAEETAVQPSAGMGESAALNYLESLKASCGCGVIITPDV